MFKFVFLVLAVASAYAAPGYLGDYGYLGHTAPALPLAPAYSSSLLHAPIAKYAAAPAISYAAPITKIAAPAIAAPIYKSYAAPAISYAAPSISYAHPTITKYAAAPALAYGGLAHGW